MRKEGKEGEARNETIRIAWQKLWREWLKHIVEEILSCYV